jgi:hypothetical protein
MDPFIRSIQLPRDPELRVRAESRLRLTSELNSGTQLKFIQQFGAPLHMTLSKQLQLLAHRERMREKDLTER